MTSINHIIVSLTTLFFGLSLAVFLDFWTIPGARAMDQEPLAITITAGDYEEALTGNDFAVWFRLGTTSVASQAHPSEIEDTSYCPATLWYCDAFLPRDARARVAVRVIKTLEEARVRAYVSSLATRFNQDPINALFDVDESNSVIISQTETFGRRLQENESVVQILQALRQAHKGALSLAITLSTETITPDIVSADRERLGLTDLIGEGKSNFRNSPNNRIFNINRALKQFDSVLLPPGVEFSFVEHLGPVDGENGYLPELVIKHNKTEPEFGGGICQVSSTLFRAAIYSGLKITERRNHAYAVAYYQPIGMDATIYIPKPDLKFTNNTPGYILMQPIVKGFNLAFRFFGTRDGRTVTVDGPHVLERHDDGSMKTFFIQEVNNGDGQNFIRDTFTSNYKSPSLFPHPNTEPVYTEKPKDWSGKQWKAYQATQP